MSEETMIERVARAICVARGRDPDRVYETNRSSDVGGVETAMAHEAWRDHIAAAQAAIGAMKEARGDMFKAGYEAMFADKYDGTQDAMLGAGWDAMIDEALKQ